MADILIRGLRMPKIGEFPRSVMIHPWCKTAIPVEPGADDYETVEIPDHGRLIDADEFESYVQNQWELNEISNGDWIQFREWLKDQQTIIPASKEADNAP